MGTSEEHSIRDIALTIADLLDIDRARVRFDPSKPNGVSRRATDTSRFQTLSRFQFTPLRDALRMTLASFDVPLAV